MLNPAALPKYMQVSERLARSIQAGQLRHGTRLPPERDLAEDMGVAVGTLRRALDLLAEQGMLDRVQGSGNYIQKPAQPSNIYAFFRLESSTGPGLPTAHLLSVSLLQKPAHLPAFGNSDTAHCIQRIRALDGVPVAAEEIWLDGSAAHRITARDLSESLYHFYRTRLGLTILSVEDRIAQADPPDWATPHLDLPAPAPHVARLSWAGEDRPIEYSRTWIDPRRAVYVARS